MPFLHHGSYRMSYELEGPENAPAYVLINGLPQHKLGRESRHAEVRKLWIETLDGVGMSGPRLE